jgi:hypothetical protein
VGALVPRDRKVVVQRTNSNELDRPTSIFDAQALALRKEYQSCQTTEQ